MREQEVNYVMQHTKVLYVPDRRIDTFGDTRFNFHMVSELMDEVGASRVRSGWIEASRPRIMRPADLMGVEFEGFGETAQRMAEWLSERGNEMSFLCRYGFRFSRSEVREEIVHEDILTVSDRLRESALSSGNPLLAVISGVDDAWELSLLYFMVTMIRESYEINMFDFRHRGIL
ncbi:MAG: hypothetical protein IJB00_03740 [Akkermansia sp.]|nr:hypothetical protein [Akkermansia sp.]